MLHSLDICGVELLRSPGRERGSMRVVNPQKEPIPADPESRMLPPGACPALGCPSQNPGVDVLGHERREGRREERETFGARGNADRYQMREKLLSIGDDFWIEDESERRAFKVNGKALRCARR